MANDYFTFRQFTIRQENAVFKVGTDGVLLGACSDLPGSGKVLDIGTGTGLIALMAAQRSEANISAIEPDAESYNQAVANVLASRWKERIQVFHTDLQSYIVGNEQKFDSILTNPPYFRNSLRNPDLAKSAARHTFALSSEDILDACSRMLNNEGNLQLILPYKEGTLFIAEAVSYGLFCSNIIKVKPNPTGNVIRMILKFERNRKPVYERFLTIENGIRHQYTEDFKEITRDFYKNI